MIDRAQLLSYLQTVLRRLEADLLERSEEMPEIREALEREHRRAREADRTAQNYEEWRSDTITQTAAAWVLSCVFARFLEDNRLVDPPRIAGPGERLARAWDEHELYFRAHPTETDREYLLHTFDELARLPGAKEIFGRHNPIRELVQRALDSVHGVDVNPYAVAIACFRLLLVALHESGIRRLQDAPDFHFNLAVGDSLLHGVPRGDQQVFGFHELAHHYQSEDLVTLRSILRPGTYHAVVANPPYITAKDKALNQAYRERYSACHLKYSLAVPFVQRIFSLVCKDGSTITRANYSQSQSHEWEASY